MTDTNTHRSNELKLSICDNCELLKATIEKLRPALERAKELGRHALFLCGGHTDGHNPGDCEDCDKTRGFFAALLDVEVKPAPEYGPCLTCPHSPGHHWVGACCACPCKGTPPPEVKP